ncbi:hypothetical protein BDV96DRAFT_684733 [Lophiotrema nucula]|uniref:F-box domain-containing protein n=1 Tax=Lophiotrema nucula TaxID=690887 RepID=A0A6A5ZJ44_9PLEO|nr:hypothetical protein BDV96DRAFT_684733 [Lophiotrema nucula]
MYVTRWATEDEVREYQLLSYDAPAHATELFSVFLSTALEAGLIPNLQWNSDLELSPLPPALRDPRVEFVQCLENGFEEAYVLLILALLPNLERLCIKDFVHYKELDRNLFLSRSTTALRKLQELEIVGPEADRDLQQRYSLEILDILPFLRILKFELIILEVYPNPCQLLCIIRLFDVVIAKGKLRDLLTSCEPLVKFEYIVDTYQCYSDGEVFSWSDIAHALSFSQTTLKYLGLYDRGTDLTRTIL